ncbi:MAG: adenylosuccinate synthetase [Opitutales bacterium]|nr:adenylosuccinate synthetase [Opitutales bacterium]
MALIPFNGRIIADCGISFGDEGKGRLIPEIIAELKESTGLEKPVEMVLKVNGGANSGHTCGGLKLNLFPAGVVSASVPCLGIGAGVVADPRKFVWEAAYIEQNGYSVMPRLLIDEKTMLSDVSHRMLDLAWEHYRVNVIGDVSRGSTGRGISPAYCDETSHLQIFYYELLGDRAEFARKMKNRLERAAKTIRCVCEVDEEMWSGFFDVLTNAEVRANANLIESGRFTKNEFDFTRFKGDAPFTFNVDAVVETYWNAGQILRNNIGELREKVLGILDRGRYIVAEFGQSFWLDKRFGFTRSLTASHTCAQEFFNSACVPLKPLHVVGVAKAYDTKVGNHVFITQMPDEHPLAKKLKELEYGTSTGRQRMVGWYDAVEKGDALRYAGYDDMMINKLDALSYSGSWNGGELLICTHYIDRDGKPVYHVPRNGAVHETLRPSYIQLPGWSEDISAIRSFADLPANARRYIAAMAKTTLDVAFRGQQLPGSLPNLRYVGVGPLPSQIIRDIPEMPELLKLA